MSDKFEIEPGDQIVLTRVHEGGTVKFHVHRTGPDRGIAGALAFKGTFDEAVQHIREHYVIE